MDRDLREHATGRDRDQRGLGRGEQAARRVAEGNRGNFLDPRHRDQDQWHQQGQAQRQGEGGAPDEVVGLLVGENVGDPGADAVGGRRQHQRLHWRGCHQLQDRQRQQDADQQRDAHQFPVGLIDHRAAPGEFRLARGVQDTPIRTDAAFEEFPGLIDRLDDVVFHADRFGAADEGAQRHRLLERAGDRALEIVAGTRPAEFGDHDPLAGKGVAQLLIDDQRLVDGLLVRKPFPVRQDMRGDEIDGGGQFGVLDPDVPDLAGGDRHVDLALHLLDQFDEIFDLLLATKHRFVADHDAVDVAVALGQFDRGHHLAFVAIDVLVDPGADHDLEAGLVGDRRHQFDATGRRIQTNAAADAGQRLQIRTDAFRIGNVVDVGMRRAVERRVGDAGENALEVRCFLPLAQNSPEGGVSGSDEQQDGDDGAHRE